ncbi:hypothetical protein DVS77_14910 [Mycolicibacterium moriokaense]|nr:hypothetical protein DVS77_14910 [Mycolicibacterium moriokaense]
MSEHAEPPAIACALSGADYRDRLAWIAELNRAALRSYRRVGPHVELVYDSAAAPQVYEFVRRERTCCPFLEFAVRLEDGTLTVQIDAPDQAADAADALFQPYLIGGST